MSQELPGRGLGRGGKGSLGRRAPASPGTAAWTQTACRWCVSVSILCPPVHDMLQCPQFPSPAPQLPADCVLVAGNGLSCVVRHGEAKLSCPHTGGAREPALRAGGRRAGGGGTSRDARTALGEGPPAGSITFFSVCLSLFFPFALSVSSLLIRSPNPPAFTVEKPDTQVSGAPGRTQEPGTRTRSAHLAGGGRDPPTCAGQVWIQTPRGWFRGGGRGCFKNVK